MFGVRLPGVDDFALAGDRAWGVLAPLQRLDLSDVANVVDHVRTHGLGLLWDIIEETDAETVKNSGGHTGVVKRALKTPLDAPRREQLRAIQQLWPALAQSTNLVALHEGKLHQVVEILRSALRGRDSRWDWYTRAEVTLTLVPSPNGPVVVLGRYEPPSGSESASNRASPVTTMSPYLRARLEGLLAMSVDGPGLGLCAFCERPFVQVRSGDRYSKFCPGYDCDDLYRKQHYEKSDYRREYRRRQLALKRLTARPDSSAATTKAATREFEAWKAHAKQVRAEETPR